MFSEEKITEIKRKLSEKEKYTNEVKDFLLRSELRINDIFSIAISELTSQMYGPLLQKIIMRKNSLSFVPSSMNKGDAKTDTNKFYEIKCGQVNKGKIKLFQVRPYQEINGYITCHYFAENDEMFCFLIPHPFMVDFCSSIASSSHGAGIYKNEEKQVEIDIYNLKEFLRYRIDFPDLINAVR